MLWKLCNGSYHHEYFERSEMGSGSGSEKYHPLGMSCGLARGPPGSPRYNAEKKECSGRDLKSTILAKVHGGHIRFSFVPGVEGGGAVENTIY